MDTSASDVSLADFNESYRVPRKRKKKIVPPLKFKEDPMDYSFDSPDRPRAAVNPRGAPCVDINDNTHNWISPDTFGTRAAPQLTNRTLRKSLRHATKMACSRRDCHNIHHRHEISLSSNDSDLLLAVEPTVNNTPPQSSTALTSTPVRSTSSGYSSGDLTQITKIVHQVSPSSSVSSVTLSPSPFSPGLASPEAETPPLNLKNFRTVGYSQCKSTHKLKKTRRPRNQENIPMSPLQVPESPILPSSKYRRLSDVSTPKDKGVLLVEDTPEHLTGLRMVSRRLREVLGDPVCDSLQR